MVKINRKPKEYRGRCGNCQAPLLKGARYCDQCGTKKGNGEFKPFENTIRILYGPPIKIIQHCEACNYKWLKAGIGVKKSSYCPKCNSPSIEMLEFSRWHYGETLGHYLEDNEPLQLFTKDEVNKILSLREEYKNFQNRNEDYNAIHRFMNQNGFEEHAKELKDTILSNREAERINLSKKILMVVGNENALIADCVCPKCEGIIASQIKIEKKTKFPKANTLKDSEIYSLSEDYVNQDASKDDLMCLQCGHVFKNPTKKK